MVSVPAVTPPRHAPGAALCAAILSAAAIPACEPPQEGAGTTLLPDLQVEEVGPSPILPGTRLVVRGSGFVPPEVASLSVELRPAAGPGPVVLPAEREDDETLLAKVTAESAAALLQAGGVFEGEIAVVRRPAGGEPAAEATVSVSIPVAEALEPTLDALTPGVLHVGDVLELAGGGFLQPGEGVSLVEFEGVFRPEAPAAPETIAGLVVPAVPPAPDDRSTLELVLTPDLLGVRPGVFEGTVRVLNSHAGGEEIASEPLEAGGPGGLALEPARIDLVTPLAASRGQRIEVHGDGLLPPDGLLQAGTLLLLAGVFTPSRGAALDWTGKDALAVFPDAFAGNALAHVVLRAGEDATGETTGLGAHPGVFEGTVRPLVYFGATSALGDALPLAFTVKPATQVVFLRFLPTFDDALLDFGLLQGRDGVVARILEVAARDYEGINIAFVTSPPADFVEYMVVEVGGHDPNGTGLFGLDNTKGKDVGNLRFDDVIGGFNADTRARGFAAFGGIFVSEMVQLSPSLSDSELASPRFDDLFGPFSPLLGGDPADPEEVGGAGARAPAVAEAIRVLGNVVGNTITHEVGHSLGLAAIEGHFHDIGDNPGWIMDAGSFRPFEERAEIDGVPAAVFAPFDRAYLEEVLPMKP